MKKINFPALALATLVILMFCLVGVAMAYNNFLLMFLFFLLGNVIMGFGIYLKRRKGKSDVS